MTTALLLSGCDDAATPKSDLPLPKAKSLETPVAVANSTGNGDAATKEKNFDGAIFQVPAAWEEVPKKSEFITAEFKVTGTGGPARLTLSTAGGDVASNIQRWKGQFTPSPSDPSSKESSLTSDGKEATLVELFGSFRDGLGGGEPQPDSAMLGVVIPLGKTNYFIKLTGPRTTVTETREALIKFVETAKFNE